MPPNLDLYRRRLNPLLARHSQAMACVRQEGEALKAAETRLADLEAARGLVQEVARTIQAQVHQQISSVVSRCLSAVFGESAYQFKIDFVAKRGKTEANLLFVRDGKEIDPLDAAGGGVVQVASLALRVACLVLTRPKRRMFLALDEPTSMLSKEYRPAFREMLKALSRDMGIQFLLITHDRELQVGKVIVLERSAPGF